MFYVYVLRSESDSGFYIGFSTNLRARLKQHQDGESPATKPRDPWKLIYYEAYTGGTRRGRGNQAGSELTFITNHR